MRHPGPPSTPLRVVSLTALLALLLRWRVVRGRELADREEAGCPQPHRGACGSLGQWCCCQATRGEEAAGHRAGAARLGSLRVKFRAALAAAIKSLTTGKRKHTVRCSRGLLLRRVAQEWRSTRPAAPPPASSVSSSRCHPLGGRAPAPRPRSAWRRRRQARPVLWRPEHGGGATCHSSGCSTLSTRCCVEAACVIHAG